MNQEEVVTAILETAADVANREVAGKLPLVEGAVFAPNPLSSRKFGFCLTFSEAVFNRAAEPEIAEIRALLTGIAVRAVRDAIVTHGQDFAALMVTHAKHNQNFFGKDEGIQVL